MLSNSGINKVFLVGHIGKEPYLHSVANEPDMLCFPMVTTEFIKKNGASVEHIEWHQVKIPHNYVDADNVLKKGQLVYIQGKIQTLQFTDEQHIKRYKTEIMAQYIQILSNNIEQTLVQD